MEQIGNYIWIKKLDLDLVEQEEAATDIYNRIMDFYNSAKNPAMLKTGFHKTANVSTQIFYQYNYFSSVYPAVFRLFREVRNMFYRCIESHPGEKFDHWFIHGWINYYQPGEYIDWHVHYPPYFQSWHGVYCLSVEPDSNTQYRIPKSPGQILSVDSHLDEYREVTVEGSNNLLFMSPSDGNLHRSSHWNQQHPRITIAFDIIPEIFKQDVGQESWINIERLRTRHFIPLL